MLKAVISLSGGYDYEGEDDMMNGMDEDRPLDEEEHENAAEGEGTSGMAGVEPARADKTKPGRRQEFTTPNDVRVTTRYMTKYERARILGTRALQIR